MTGSGGPIVLDGLDGVRAAVGTELGTSDWTTVTTEQLDLYAEATGDRASDGAGGPVAPVGLVLALTNLFLPQIIEVRGVRAGINYGTGPVRFPAAVPVGGRMRGRARLTATDEVRGGVQTTMALTVDVAGSDLAACTVESLTRWLA